MKHICPSLPAFLPILLLTCAASLCSDEGLRLPRLPVPSVEQSIVREAWAHGVPVRLAFWLAVSESGLRPGAVRLERNGSYSLGIFQTNTASFPTAAWMTPQENITAGVAYLATQYRACHKKPGCAVRAYRSGRVR